jgi:hypothetical protein
MSSGKLAAIPDVIRRRGRVPDLEAPGDRRNWLLGLTADELRVLTRTHGVDREAFSACLGWGAHASGSTDGEPVRCTRCGRKSGPLWFYEDGVEIARCWACAAVDHFVICDRWEP